MVDTTRASEGKYVNADMVRDSPTKKLVIMDEGEYVEGDYGEKFQLTVEIDGKQKIWSPNKDSIKNIQDVKGKDSKNWIGVIVQLSNLKIRGKDTVNGFPLQ
jgi:hypothetical protein